MTLRRSVDCDRDFDVALEFFNQIIIILIQLFNYCYEKY